MDGTEVVRSSQENTGEALLENGNSQLQHMEKEQKMMINYTIKLSTCFK